MEWKPFIVEGELKDQQSAWEIVSEESKGYHAQRDEALDLLVECSKFQRNSVVEAAVWMKVDRMIIEMKKEDSIPSIPEPLGRTRHTRDDHGNKIDEIIEFLRVKLG